MKKKRRHKIEGRKSQLRKDYRIEEEKGNR